MKAVLISIQPKWVEKIARGEKTIEVRKSVPKLERPFKVYIYCTKEKRKDDFITISGAFSLIRCPECAIYNRVKEYDCNGKVIGEFICRGMMDGGSHLLPKQSCLTIDEILDYAKGKRVYGWRIADLKIYGKPKELSEFTKYMDCKNAYDCCACHNWDRLNLKCIAMNNEVKRPPQSWCYVEELQNG